MARFNIDDIFKNIEAKWKHVAYDPKSDKMYLLTDPYRCLDTRAAWFDFQDGRDLKSNNDRRIRVSKTKHWVYIGKK